MKTDSATAALGGPRPVSNITRQIPAIAAGLTALFATLAWVGWLCGQPVLASWAPGMPTMAPNSVIAFLLAALALALQRHVDLAPLPAGPRRWIARLAAAGIFGIGAFKLSEYVFGFNSDLNHLFHRLLASEPLPASHARMAPHTAFAFTLLGPALLLLGGNSKRFWRAAPWVATVPALIAVASLIGHWYGLAIALHGYAMLNRMALNSGVTFILLAAGILCVRPDERPVSLLRDRGAAGKSLRRLLPVALGLPLVFGWIEDAGVRAGLWSVALGDALVAVVSSLVLVAFIWQSARHTFAAEQRVHAAKAALEKEVEARTAQLRAVNDQLRADAAARAATERELIESEERFRAAFAHAAIGMALTDLDGRYLQVNEAYCRICGYSAEELKRLDFGVLSHPDDMPAKRALLAQMLRGEIPSFVIEKRYIKKSGEPVWVKNSVSLIRDANGRPANIIALTEDITVRRHVEEQLQLSEERQRLAIEAAQLGTFYCPVPLGEIIWNAQCKAHFWLPPDAEINFDLFYSLLHPDDREPTRRAIEQALLERATYDVEYRTVAPDGSGRTRWVRAIGRGYYHETSGELRRFDGITIDITDRKQVAAEAERNAERVRTILESITSAFFSVDRAWRFTYVNDEAERLLAHPRADLLGRSLWEEFPAAVGTDFEREYRRAMETGQPAAFEELYAPLKIWFEVRAFPSAEGLSVYFQDINPRKAAEAERDRLLVQERDARATAETANRLKDEFLATLSHELRTPLNAILGWAHLLRGSSSGGGDGPEDRETWTSGLEVIERNAKAQVQLIEDLLDVSRIITGKLRLDVRPVDLEEIVRAALDAVRPAAEARGVRLQPVLDPRAGPVNGDPDRLQQIVWNLLSNAIKFTPRGGRVQVFLERVNSHVEIIVSDTGAGIAPEFLPFLFDRFRQADSSTTRRHGGLGLGLAIVRHLVEMHGGSVEAASPGLGQGTTLTVRLPLLIVYGTTRDRGDSDNDGEDRGRASASRSSRDGDVSSLQPRAIEQDGALFAPESPLSKTGTTQRIAQFNQEHHRLDGLRVLAVDDERDALDLLEAVFSRAGAHVFLARNAAEALVFFEPDIPPARRPDVLISDIGMPDEDGYSLIAKLRALGPARGGNLPAVALTAHARAEDRLRALAAGFDTQATKPIDPAELVLIVARQAERLKAKG